MSNRAKAMAAANAKRLAKLAERKAIAAEGLKVQRRSNKLEGVRMGIEHAKQAKGAVGSRIVKAWSDTFHAPAPTIAYDVSEWNRLAAMRKPLVHYVGATKTVKSIQTLGPECLYDDCIVVPKARLHWPVGTLPPWNDAYRRPPTAREQAIDQLVSEWRGRVMLGYLELLGVDT